VRSAKRGLLATAAAWAVGFSVGAAIFKRKMLAPLAEEFLNDYIYLAIAVSLPLLGLIVRVLRGPLKSFFAYLLRLDDDLYR
jgi:hypothetical protein